MAASSSAGPSSSSCLSATPGERSGKGQYLDIKNIVLEHRLKDDEIGVQEKRRERRQRSTTREGGASGAHAPYNTCSAWAGRGEINTCAFITFSLKFLIT